MPGTGALRLADQLDRPPEHVLPMQPRADRVEHAQHDAVDVTGRARHPDQVGTGEVAHAVRADRHGRIVLADGVLARDHAVLAGGAEPDQPRAGRVPGRSPR